MSDIELEDDIIDSLIEFHAFTGNDFISSFFRKGKNTCFKLLESSSRFKTAFAQLDTLWELSDDTFDALESFVVRLYGIKKAMSVDEARYKMFSKKLRSELVLRLHRERTNYMAAT